MMYIYNNRDAFLKFSVDATLQNFIYKHTANLENVQISKKKEKGEFT